jgi:hypothetical protein
MGNGLLRPAWEAFVPGPGHEDLARGHEARQFGRVGPVGAQVRMDLAQPVGGGLELFFCRGRPVGHAGRQVGQRIGVVDVVGQRHALGIGRVEEHISEATSSAGTARRVVGDRRRAPVGRHEEQFFPARADLGAEKVGVERAVGLDPGPVPRDQDPGVRPFPHRPAADMRDVGAEARADLLERLFLVTEEGEGRAVAVLRDVTRMELGVFEARVVEDEKIAVLGHGRAGGKDKREGGGAGKAGVHSFVSLPVGREVGAYLCKTLPGGKGSARA